MRILAVTCYTGGESLCKMTEDLISSLRETLPTGHEMIVSVTAQGAARNVEADVLTVAEKNIGFAYGMNKAIEEGLKEFVAPDYVLCLNNDLVLNQDNWLERLLASAIGNKIASPITDVAAHHTAIGPLDVASSDVAEVSAYCWLIPMGFCKLLKKKHGFWLFSEDFAPAYGEDDWTSYLLTKELGPNIFRLVFSSFVRHLKAKTSAVVPHSRSKTSKILADKFRGELATKKLRPDLKLWAQRYLRILKC